MRESPTLDPARELLHLIISRSTTRTKIDERAYRAARRDVMADPAAARLAPECARICRTPDEVWSYVKSRGGLDTYESRRQFFRGEFEPLLSSLERFESAPVDDLVSAEADRLSSESVIAAWSKALERRASDPDGAITAARTLMESVCKTILDDSGEPYGSGDDLPKLYRTVSKTLKLAPADYTDEQLRRILGGVTTVVEGLGSLRNARGMLTGAVGRDTGQAHATLGWRSIWPDRSQSSS